MNTLDKDTFHDGLEVAIENIRDNNKYDFDRVIDKIDSLDRKLDKLIEILNLMFE